MNNEKLQELERLAKAATPGEWRIGMYPSECAGPGDVVVDNDIGPYAILTGNSNFPLDAKANAAYAVAAKPSTMQELIAAVRDSRARVAELEAAVAPAQPAQVVDAGELPPLPEPSPTHYRDVGLTIERMEMYTADQMRAYARAAIAQQAAPASPPPADAAGERAAFERHFGGQGFDMQKFTDKNGQHYEMNGIRAYWIGWDARAALAQRQADAPGDALDAARYQYLRDSAWKRKPDLFEGGRAALMIGNHGEALDSAIDAAIAQARAAG